MIIAGMATIPGREESCKEAILSIMYQVEMLHVFSDFDFPDWGFDDKPVQFHKMSGGDERKFRGLTQEYKNYYGKYLTYFSLDDDLIYPPDYVSKTIAQFTEKKEILTYHGRIIQSPMQSYYRGAKERFYCLAKEDEDRQINIPGTGVMCFRPKDFILSANDFPAEFPLMSDIHVGIAAQKQRVPIRLLKHEGEWIKHNGQVNVDTTIYARFKNADTLQTEKVNSMDWKIYS